MKCQACGKEDAHVHLTDIIDGEKRTVVLCESCAAEKGYVIDPGLIQAAATQIQKLIAPWVPTAAKSGSSSRTPETEVTCPTCGNTWSAFKKHSRFGCAHDYEAFGERVARLLESIHGTSEHQGSAPTRARAAMERRRRLAELREGLRDAVDREDFEEAAGLRDQIRLLESGDGDGGPSN